MIAARFGRVILMLALLAGAAVLAPASAQTGPIVTRTATPLFSLVLPDDIYVRSGPGSNFSTVGSLRAGNVLRPLNISEDGEWVLITYGRGVGWVRRDLGFWIEEIDALPVLLDADLTVTPVDATAESPFVFASATPEGNWMRLEGQAAYLRAGPGSSYPIVGSIPPGTLLEPAGRDEAGNWILVRQPGGFAWVARPLVAWADDLTGLPVLIPPLLTPSPTFTRTPRPSQTPTYTPTRTPSSSPTPQPTDTATATATATITPSPSATVQPTETPSATRTPPPTATNSATATRQPPTLLALVTNTPAASAVPETLIAPQPATATAALPPTSAPARTLQPPVVTVSPPPSSTATRTPRPTLSPTPSATPSPTASATHTARPAATSTATPSQTPTRTYTSAPTATATQTPASTSTPSLTHTPTASASPTPGATRTVRPSRTAPAPTVAVTVASGQVVTSSPAHTPLFTASPAATATRTPAPTLTPSLTHTPTASASPTPEATRTARPSHTASAPADTATVASGQVVTPVPETATPTMSRTARPATQTPAPSNTAAATASATRTPTVAASVTATASPQPGPTAEVTAEMTAAVSPAEPGPGGPVAGPPAPAANNGPAIVIGLAALAAIVMYGVLYWRGAAAVDRYKDGFIIHSCPVCGRGELEVETRVARIAGIPRPTHTVRCDSCRSVLREVRPGRWRYAVDPMENADLAARYNGKVISAATLRTLDLNRRGRGPE